MGADLFLSKPVNYKELRRQIEFVLSNKTHMEELEESEAICECLLRLMSHLDCQSVLSQSDRKRICQEAGYAAGAVGAQHQAGGYGRRAA